MLNTTEKKPNVKVTIDRMESRKIKVKQDGISTPYWFDFFPECPDGIEYPDSPKGELELLTEAGGSVIIKKGDENYDAIRKAMLRAELQEANIDGTFDHVFVKFLRSEIKKYKGAN
jgi:hypothetical protein